MNKIDLNSFAKALNSAARERPREFFRGSAEYPGATYLELLNMRQDAARDLGLACTADELEEKQARLVRISAALASWS